MSLIMAGLLAVSVSVGAKEVDIEEVRALMSQNRLEEAEDRLNDMPRDIHSRLLLGVVLSKQGKLEAATEEFEALASEHPELPQPLNNLAVLYAARGMTEQAREKLLRAVELQPRHANAHRNLGDLYLHMAMDAYAHAHRLKPESSHLANKIEMLNQVLAGASSLAREPIDNHRVDSKPKQLATGPDASQPKPNTTQRPATKPLVRSIASMREPLDSLPASQADASCFELGPYLKQSSLRQAERWLKERGMERLSIQERRMPVAIIYQVYLPPLESLEAARAKARELTSKGVKEKAVIRSGSLTHGISLGAFKEEPRAHKQMRWLSGKGIKGLRVRTQRPDKDTQWLRVSLDEQQRFDEAAFKQAFPKTRRIASSCP